MVSVIPLGELPLANALLSSYSSQEEPKYNLEVMLCKSCGLAQLKDLVSPKELFAHYVYFSSNSEAMLSSVKELTQRIIPTLPSDAFVIEIASNDGYLLKNYVSENVSVMGIDPAANIAKVANEKGIPTLCDFFSAELAKQLSVEGKTADIIHANNVMAHVPDVNGFVEGLKILLKKEGTAIIEVPYFLELLKKLEFDTIYHEHVYYFSAYALKPLFLRHGLEIYDIHLIPIHGGSLRLFVGHSGQKTVLPVVDRMIADELQFGVQNLSTYEHFMERLLGLKKDLKAKISELKTVGAVIAAYGASAKGTTLLNYFDIGKKELQFVVDRSTVKQGLFTPGKHLEILSPSNLNDKKITHALLLSWNFSEEILKQQKDFIAGGGKFILPLPEVQILP